MKVILTGATGHIGGAVLQRLLAVPAVTSIIVLSRRELTVKDAKLKTIIIKDFLHYDKDVLDQLAGAEACIWVLGTPTQGKDVHNDMTFAATKAFAENVLPALGKGKQFRYLYTSGAAVVRDQNASLWFLDKTRKLRGVVEIGVVDLEEQYGEQWKSYIVRPAAVTTGKPIWSFVFGGWWIPKEELAAAMVDIAVNGGEKQTLESAELRQRGQASLDQQ
ncbi:hypothetical protein CKM354_000803000 [Cercospora kikuchii]|uniref:NAD(P)-binding domain-containing protein n=1 Tax=Cercospora kikuchii TaxID=84275 RepID=A0A9P3CI60_9PEZI|nr:uncharacterized protein CKM354_000803000 [Cercospora kikuchii]GIZ44844.1 hypothetical protein CKM354_000803000 [Cercospora kikuchii]